MRLSTSARPVPNNAKTILGISILVLVLAGFLGSRPSLLWLGLLAAGAGTVVVLQKPALGLAALILAALAIPVEVSTGTSVSLNPAALLVPVLLGIWVPDMVRRQNVRVVASRTNKPLALFLIAGLLSLLIGTALWDPAVPRSSDFLIVQLAQWAIFVFCAGAFWLTAHLIRDTVGLRHLTFLFLLTGGLLVLLVVFSGGANLVELNVATIAIARAPFVLLLAALAGGQLLFNEKLSAAWRFYLIALLGAVAVYAFALMGSSVSFWIGVATAGGVLAWLRWPRLRWLAVILLVTLAASEYLTTTVYEFAGGEAEWLESGGSRLALIDRVVDVSLRNPITGLGPAAYRIYAGLKPLQYYDALWLSPKVSSHNNYVDLFSQVGILGLGLFLWFVAEVTRLALRLRGRYTKGFAAGYVNGMLAVGVGALILMLFADWILPFVYNVGFPGFQASVLIWLFLGGLVVLDNIAPQETAKEAEHAT
jgi:O-antigen ligase